VRDFEKPIGERRLPVVYVGDDTKITNSVLGYRHNMPLYRLCPKAPKGIY
jgi:hypothetical protein